MSLQNGRALVLKIGDGAEAETFQTLGAAQAVSVKIAQPPVDATPASGGGFARPRADAAVQEMEITLEGLFHDSAAEGLLFGAALARAENFILAFPNGDSYAAAFIVAAYSRSGGGAGELESFAVTLRRSGAGAYTEAS